MDEECRHLLRMLGADQDIEIADCLLAAAEAAGLTDLSHRFVGTQVGKQLLGKNRDHVDAETPGMLAVVLDGLE